MKIKYTKLPPALPKFYKYIKDEIPFCVKDKYLQAPYAAATCTRCGACLQKCPSFKALKSELYSPRGRSQLVRFLYEGKLSPKEDKKDILNTTHSCFMCGACTSSCPAKTPVADLMFFVNSALGKRKIKISVMLKNLFYLPFAKLKIKNTLKNQPDLKQKCLLVVCGNSAENIKIAVELLNLAGFKVDVSFALIKAEQYYFTANLQKLKKCFINLQKQITGQQFLIADCPEIYALLTKAQMFLPELKDITAKTKFISSFIKKKNLKAELKDKKILLHQNNMVLNSADLQKDISALLYCPSNNFLVECIQSKDMPLAAAAAWIKIKGDGLIKDSSAKILKQYKADFIITASYTDRKFFERLIKKHKLSTKVLHILRLPINFYAEK